MKRLRSSPRQAWQEIVQAEGLLWHDSGPEGYWDESAYYEFSLAEIDAIEAATNELHQMCLAAAQHVIDNSLYAHFGIPEILIPLIESSWNEEPPSLYGRFDLAVGEGTIKMLEYNADTPTALLEAAVTQWTWFEQTRYGSDQFNSIHDRLIETWKYFSDWIPGKRIAFTSVDSVEDGFTLAYLQETASQAGYQTDSFPINEMGWNGSQFVSGNSEDHLAVIFKLYPWEWLAAEPFGQFLRRSPAVWIEPSWKALLSNKGILTVLAELYPDHPYLLDARLDPPPDLSGWVRKPLMGREGANVTIFGKDRKPGEYGETGYVYQRDAGIRPYDGNYPVVGSWIIGQQASGIGIREARGPITDNTSRFVPHVII